MTRGKDADSGQGSFFNDFSNLSLDSLTNDAHFLHLNVTTGPTRITVNSAPPQGWGFRSLTVAAEGSRVPG